MARPSGDEHNELLERAKGFMSGVASGLTKLAIGHPFVRANPVAS